MRNIASTLLSAALTVTLLAGCGPRAGDTEAGLTPLTPLSPEGAALAALGYQPEDLVPGDPVATADPRRWQGWRRRHAARVAVREHVLHGEVTVETSDGTRTVLVQRGEIADIGGTTVTVVSTDGFEQTWTYGEALRVIESRTTVEPRELSTGDEVGVAGHDREGTPIAGLIVIPVR